MRARLWKAANALMNFIDTNTGNKLRHGFRYLSHETNKILIQ